MIRPIIQFPSLGGGGSGLPSDYILLDSASEPSIHLDLRALITAAGVSSILWNVRTQLDSSGNEAIAWGDRKLKDATEADVIDWSSYCNVKTAGAASRSNLGLTGTIFTGGTGTTTLPAFLIQPTGTTAATNWNTSGTLWGGNAPSGFVGDLINEKVAGVTAFKVAYDGFLTAGKALFQNAANSTTAFEVQNVAGSPIFGVNTVDRFVQLGGDAFGTSASTGNTYLYNNGLLIWSTNSGASGGISSPGPSFGCCTGTPEGVVTANVGSIRVRADGGLLSSFYVKESGTGNTGWVAK